MQETAPKAAASANTRQAPMTNAAASTMPIGGVPAWKVHSGMTIAASACRVCAPSSSCRLREAVACDAGKEAEQDVRHERHRRHESRGARRPAAVEDEPGQRNGRDPHRQRVERLGGEEEPAVAPREQRVRGARESHRSRVASYRDENLGSSRIPPVRDARTVGP